MKTMKKIALLLVAAMSASLLSAQTFKLSGHVRAGFSGRVNGTTDDDGDDTISATAEDWVHGIYFVGDADDSRIRLDGEVVNEEGTYGASGRYQYAKDLGAISFSATEIIYANAWGKFLDQKLFVSAGRLKDLYFTTQGFETFTFITKKTGAQVVFAPIPELKVGVAAVYDYLDAYYTDDDERVELHPLDSDYSSGTKEFSEKVLVGAVSYSKDFLSVRVSGAAAGAAAASVSLKFPNGIKFTAEGIYQTQEARNERRMGKSTTGRMFPAQVVLVENLEYTGLDKWLFGVASYQHFKDTHYLNEEGESLNYISVIPAVRYNLFDNVALSLEATIRFFDSDWDAEDTDVLANFVPRVDFIIKKGFTASVWGDFSTDDERVAYDRGNSGQQMYHSVGVGACLTF